MANKKVLTIKGKKYPLKKSVGIPKPTNISAKDILKEVDALINKKYIPIPHRDIFKELLNSISKFDFHSEAELRENENLHIKHYIVLSIDHINKMARLNNWHIAKYNGFVYLFNRAYWKVIDRETLQAFLGACAEKMGMPKIEAKYHGNRAQLEKQFDTIGYFTSPERGDKILINLKNGTFEINGKEHFLRAPNAADFLTYQLDFSFDENTKASKWQVFLDKVVPDKQVQQVLQEYIGYIFTHLNLQAVLLLYGTGANGKSVFIEVISAMLGKENVSNYSLESITNVNSYTRANLQNKLLNVASEISGRLQSDIFKSLASGESVEARVIYGEPFTMDNYAKLLFACNELPREVEHTEGFFRRWVIVPFEQTIPKSEQNIDLAKEIISEELAGVFNWAIEGLKRLLLNKKFTVCDAIEKQNEEFRKQSDSVQLWLDEHSYYPTSQDSDKLQRLFEEYNSFCKDCNFRPLGRTKFGERLKKFGYEIEKIGKCRFVFIKSRDAEEK